MLSSSSSSSSSASPALTYIQVHLFLVVPPIFLLRHLYGPLFGRRDAIKVGWLMFMATIWTTPWDNWIISRSAWSYPPGSILFKIWHVPFEEHLFFLLQPVLLILLQALIGLPRAIPFQWQDKPLVRSVDAGPEGQDASSKGRKRMDEDKVQTLPRRPLAAFTWLCIMTIGAIGLFIPPTSLPDLVLHPLDTTATLLPLHPIEGRLFYLSAILVWISPVLALLTGLGAKVDLEGDWIAWAVGTGYLWMVDTIAIRAGSWAIDGERTLGIFLWRGLPVEEAFFFAVVSYLLVLASSLISHLHFLLLLAPPRTPGSTPTPRCPPANPFRHITLLTKLALSPPAIPLQLLRALESSETTLKAGSKSFSVAKLGWSREMRCGLITVYGWCRVTDDLIDDDHDEAGEVVSIETKVQSEEDAAGSLKEIESRKRRRLGMMRRFLDLAYAEDGQDELDDFLVAQVPTRAYSSFYLFSRIIVDLVPRRPFDDLLDGYQMDLEFPDKREMLELTKARADDDVPWAKISPIQTEADLVLYADRVAGSVADMIIHLTWNILTSEPITAETGWKLSPARQETLRMGRMMGQALQLVNIARDVRSDVEAIGRIYIPMQWFGAGGKEGQEQINRLAHRPGDLVGAFDAPKYTLRMLRMAETLRDGSSGAIEDLPRTAQAGTRAMVASYFEIGKEVERRGGQVPSLEQGRLRVSKRRRLTAVLWSIWGL